MYTCMYFFTPKLRATLILLLFIAGTAGGVGEEVKVPRHPRPLQAADQLQQRHGAGLRQPALTTADRYHHHQ